MFFKKYFHFLSLIFFLFWIGSPLTNTSAGELQQNISESISEQILEKPTIETWKAEVLKTEIIDTEDSESIYNSQDSVQMIFAEIKEGPEKGEKIEIINDFQELNTGDSFYIRHTLFKDGEDLYSIISISRIKPLLFLFAFFVLAVLLLGKSQGIRSLISLLFSFFAIFFILIPGILSGWDPLLGSLLVASLVLFSTIFFTHGFNRESAVSYAGTMLTVGLTSLFAAFSIYITKLTGMASEESTYLALSSGVSIDFTALLLGAFIIGFLGVLDDIAVTQSASVTEIYTSNKNLSKREVYQKAMRIGREHVGALVNTLVLAYTGASLPLILYASSTSSNALATINLEIFTTEIVRIIVGSVGLILTVPIVTILAVIYLKDYTPKGGTKSHSHAHSHLHKH